MIASYLKYRRKAKGSFRLHSPFVYDLYIKVLKRLPKKNRAEELNNRLISFVNDNPLIFNDNDCILVSYGIHKSKKSEAEWEKLRKSANVRLSIDCWSFGLAFVMERLRKEHYILRF